MSPAPSLDWLYTSLGWTLAAFAALVLLWSLFRDRSRGRRRCPRCWYSMQGVPSLTCPECGRTAKTERHLLKTRRHRRSTAAASLVILAGLATAAIPGYQRGWATQVPTIILCLFAPVDYAAALLPAPPSGTGGQSPTPPIGQQLHLEFWRRIDAGAIPRWQSRIFFSRWLRARRVDLTHLVTTPDRWPVAEPIVTIIATPAGFSSPHPPMRARVRRGIYLTGIDGDVISSIAGSDQPTQRLEVQFEFFKDTTVLYSRSFTVKANIAGHVSDFLPAVSGPALTERVRQAIDPALQWSASGGPSLWINTRNSAARAAASPSPAQPINVAVAFSVEVLLDGRVIARTPEPVAWRWFGLRDRIETLLTWDPGARERAAAAKDRLTLRVHSDPTASGRAYMSGPFDTSAAYWAGEFTAPAIRDEASATR